MNKIILLSLALVALFAVTLYVSEQSKVSDNHFSHHAYHNFFCVRYYRHRCVTKIYIFVASTYTRVCYYRFLKRHRRRARFYHKCHNVLLKKMKF